MMRPRTGLINEVVTENGHLFFGGAAVGLALNAICAPFQSKYSN